MRALALGVLACVVVAFAGGGCGDNAKSCGDGTVLENGTCIPKPGSGLICGDGTVLDELTNECVPDPSVCGGGTVLIDGHCVDPNTDVTVDVEEGPEPNGFEPGSTPAGTIQLKDTGSTIVHGCIKPLENNNPDLDVFLVTTSGPTLLKVTADGVEGLAAGFLVFGDDARLGTWFRLGLNVTTDTSKRELFLPVAGTYEIIMADTRTLLPITTSGQIIPGAGFPAAGNPDGTSCYFVTITKEAIPTAANLDLVDGATGTIGEDLKFFTAAFPTGLVAMHGVIDPEDLDHDGFPDLDSRAAASLILVNNNQLRQINDAGGGFFPADGPDTAMTFAGIKTGDAPIVILDYIWNIAAFPADFEIDLQATTTSQALATDGTAINATSVSPTFDGSIAQFGNLNLFHFDVTGAQEIDGLDITFNKPVTAVLIDQDTLFAAPFTNLTPTRTFTNYKGLIRTLAPGRYYFAVIDPNDPAGTAFTVTSTITPQTPGAISLGVVDPVDLDAFRSHAFTYDGSTELWQTFNATTTGTLGKLNLEMFDPTVTTPQQPGFAFGALDAMSIVDTVSPGNTLKQPDSTPLFGGQLAANGSTPFSRILLNPIAQLPPAPNKFLIHAAPVFGTTGTGTFSLDFEAQTFEDFGGAALPAGTVTKTGTIAALSPPQLFLFKSAPGNAVTITVDNAAATTLDFVLDTLNIDESVATSFDASNTAGAAETATFVMPLSGFVAFRVSGGSGGALGDYRVRVQIAESGYEIAAGAATFSNACIGGSVVPLSDDGSGFNVPSDEGLSAAITPPTGFQLFGTTVGNLRVSSNGFLTFNLTIGDAKFDHGLLANEPDIAIAPYWADLENVQVCQRSAGTTLTIQWIGDDLNAPQGANNVQFQAILDSTDSLIQFVYGPAHAANGSTASVGISDVSAGGSGVLQVGLDQPITTSSTAFTFEPN